MKRKIKVLAVLFLLLIAALVGGYLLWERGAGNELDKQVAAYKAAGEPIEPGDFIAVHLEDDDNAAVALREAARIDDNSKEWKAADAAAYAGEPGLPLREKEIAGFRAVVGVNPNAVAGVDEAMKRKGIDWQIPMRSPVISVLLPDLNEQRRLSRLIAWSAYLHFHNGDHAAALADLNRILFISRSVDKQPTLVSHLVAQSMMGMVGDTVFQMAPELKIGSKTGDASPDQIKALIAQLLDDGPPQLGRRRAFHGERMIELDCARGIANGTLDFSSIGTGGKRPSPAAAAVGIALKPMALADGLIMIRRTSAILAAMEASPDWPTYKLKGPGDLPPEIANEKLRHLLANMVMPSFDRAIEAEYHSTTHRRLAAVVLALRWYALDHGGKLPEKLSDLVPAYLPAVPLDTLSAGKPLRYILDPAQPILYSIGPNGIDDGGSERVIAKKGVQRTDKWSQADFVVHLTRRPRPPEETQSEPVGGPATPPPVPATSPSQ